MKQVSTAHQISGSQNFHHFCKAGLGTRKNKKLILRALMTRESACYHESGHTVVNILLHGEHLAQIQHPFGGIALSNIVGIFHAELAPEENIAIMLAGFAAQQLWEDDFEQGLRYANKVVDYSLENKYTPGLLQPDTLLSIHWIRNEFKKKNNRKPTHQEIETLLRNGIQKLVDFFKSQPKITCLIDELSVKNYKKPILNKKDIDICIQDVGITPNDIVAFASQLRNLGILDFSDSSYPQSSAE